MKLAPIKTPMRLASALATALLTASCGFLPFATQQPASPLVGTWTTEDHNQVTFRADAVVVTPDKGPATTMGPGDCNGRYKLQYGEMATDSLQKAFSSQPDLESKLQRLLVQSDYPVADVTCDQGGTTYLLLDDHQMLAVYRDAGVGGTETYTRL